MAGKLVICPTPIGNLGDMTLRALDALREADVVFAEDTRVTGRLLAALGVSGKRLERLDENRMGQRIQSALDRVSAGQMVVYCSDAGMPGVSDPGLRLVRAAQDATPALEVEVLPGPTAAATAYVASGCVATAFYFGGFFPRKASDRMAVLEGLRQLNAALIFYESPNRLVDALGALAEAYPYRRVAVCRELTKLHEEVVCGAAGELAEQFSERVQTEGGIKGEVVLVVDGPSVREEHESAADAHVRASQEALKLAVEGERPKDIARKLAENFAISRNDAYALALDARDSSLA